MQASDLFVKCLEVEGVEYIFGVPGEENADFMMSLEKSDKIRFILTRHEQGAAFMAEIYGRLTGNPAGCLGTLGPGATNLITGVADANMDRAPLLALTGQGATSRLHKESHQIMDVVDMFKPVTKWAATVYNADTIPEIIRKAVRVARGEKPGAVHIELPEDVAKHPTEAEPMTVHRYRRPGPDDKITDQAFELIKNAKKPVIIAGNGTIRKRASKQLRAFCEATGIGVLSTFMAKGAVDMDAEYCLYTIGLGSKDLPTLVIDEADLVITLGFDMVEYHPHLWNPKSNKRIIHADFLPAEIDEHYHPEVELIGDLAHTLWMLNERIRARGLPDYDLTQQATMRERMQEEFSMHAKDDVEGPIRPQKMLWDVRQVMGPDDILLSDVGAHKMWIARHYQCHEPNTSLSLLLYQYSKQENILIHSISANREHKQLKSVLGPFINTLCFAWQINSNLSLGQYLEQVKEHCLEGFKYQSIPYEKVQGVLQGNMISDSNRGIDAMFVMQNIPRIDSEISDVRFSGLDSFVEGVKYDLDVEVTKLGEGEEEVYSVQFTYNAGKLQSNFIQKLLQHFKELLAEMSVCAIEMKVDRGASQARKQLIDISPLCLEEKDKLIQLSAIGKAKHFQENTIVSCVDAITEQRENQICLLHNGDSLTYGELNKSANRLANHLFSIGIQAGDRVGLCIPRSFDSVVAMLAILKTGAAYVPLDTEYPKSRLQHIVDDAKLKCILAHKNNEALVSSLHDHSIYVDEASSLIAQSSERIQNTNIHPEQIAYVIYTSGSTGTPVGVSIPHRALINHVQWISKAYPFNVNERACHKTSINFVDSVAEIWSPILQGTEVSIVDQAEVIDLTHFVKKLADENISRIVLVPSLLKALLTSFENLAQKLPNLRTVMCGGEEVSPSLANLFFDLLPNVEMINIYGASEVASDVTSYRINDMKNHFDQGEIISSVPIGRAIDNCSVMVLDDNLNLCPVGVQGVLYASGEPLAAHYVGRSALSAESFIPNPYSNDPGARMYCLGDVGCLTESGEIKYFGREGNQVKVNGNRVNLSEVEKYLARIEFVKDMVVLSDINQSGKTEIRAFVVVSKENIAAAEIENDIFKYLSEFLPAYMIPSQISVLEDFPYLPNGKVDKRELAAKVQGSKPNRIIIAPRNQFDETLLSMWLAITETDSISIDDKLFEVGGDSIALIRFHSAISTSSDPLLKDRNIDIKISDFFKLTTIRLISDHIEGASGKEIEHESIQKIADEKRKRLKNRRVKRDIKV